MTSLLGSCRVNAPIVLSHSCLEGAAAPKRTDVIFNTDRKANHHKPGLANDRPCAVTGPPSSWRLVELIQGDQAGGEQVESEKVVDFFQVFR